MEWNQLFARRRRNRGSAELATILAGPPPGVLGMTGGFPNMTTFQTDVLSEIAARVLADDPGVALQYGPSEGLPSVREYLRERVGATQGRSPAADELMVTSGGMECIDLLCRTLIDAGDGVAVEAPTYLGAIMAFEGYEASLTGIPMDEDGMLVDTLVRASRTGTGRARLRHPRVPEPVGADALAGTPPRAGRRLPAPRRADLRGRRLPRAGLRRRAAAVAVVARPNMASCRPAPSRRSSPPASGSARAAGPASIVALLSDFKQNTDQCSGALGQRMVEEYGRAGHFDTGVPRARALYASHWAALSASLDAHMPSGCSWSEPTGGMFTWVTLPSHLDARELRPAATEAGVAYVPGRPFYVTDDGHNEMRLSFSHLDEGQLELAGRRLAGVLESALERTGAR